MTTSNAQPETLITLIIRFPEKVVQRLGATPAEVSRTVQEIVLIDLRRRGEISGGYAAKVLGINKSEFIDLLARYEVPYLDLTEEEMRAGIQAIRDHLRGASPSPTTGP
jgi:hypothetical protein